MVSKLKSGSLTEGEREESIRLSSPNGVVFLEESLGIYKKMGSDLVGGSPFHTPCDVCGSEKYRLRPSVSRSWEYIDWPCVLTGPWVPQAQHC